MKSRAPIIGGVLLAVYFVVTILLASLLGGDTEGIMVIAQILNLPITFVFGLLQGLLPLSIASNPVFQIITGLLLSFLLGWLLGAVFAVVTKKRPVGR